MNVIRYGILVLVAVIAAPWPAAAQKGDRIDDLADEIADTVERQVNQIAKHIERHADQIAERFERQADQIARTIEEQIETRQGRRGGRGQARGPEFTDTFSRTVKIGRNGTFDLENVNGDVVITGGGGDEVRIEATKRVRHPNETEARSLLSETVIRVDERGGRVDVRTDYPRRRNWAGSVDFTVSVPRDASVVLRTVSGSVRVTGVNGELRAETVSADIVAASTQRVRMLKSVSGDIEISDAEAQELTAGSINGDVVVNKVKANGLDIQNVSGDIRIMDVEADHATLRSISGDIEYAGRLSRSGRYEIQSHSGDVRLTPGDGRGFALTASTFSGDVRSDYPLTLQSAPGNSLTPRRGRNQSIRGSFGDGSATLSVQSFSGDIVILKR